MTPIDKLAALALQAWMRNGDPASAPMFPALKLLADMIPLEALWSGIPDIDKPQWRAVARTMIEALKDKGTREEIVHGSN